MLKLKVEDAEDLQILSACVQDALFKLEDATFVEGSQSFIMLLDRYCWEKEDLDKKAYYRSKAALHIEMANGYELFFETDKPKTHEFSLLSMHLKDDTIFLHCVDQSIFSVKINALKIFLRDIEEARQVDQRPDHIEATSSSN